MCKYLIHYFSGTGNTYHMVKVIEHEIRSKGYEVDLLNIEKDVNIELNDYEFHVFCFPAYGFGAPSIMVRYISNLNIVYQKKAAIMCTSAGFEGQSLSHLKYLLNKKGFKTFLTDMIIYTYNWTQILNPQSKETEAKVFKEAEDKIIEVTKKITNNETSFLKRNILTLALSRAIFIGFSKLGRRILGKCFITDNSCINCGKCKEICPVKAIDMHKGKPRWNLKCESCQRCINSCPKKSIQLSVVKLLIFIMAELSPILIIMDINNYFIHLPAIFNIILFFILFIINTFLVDILICLMEKVKVFRKLFEISYTKKYRRNIAKGFKI